MKTKKANKIKTKIKVNKIWVKVVIVLGVLGLLFYFKNWFVVGWVNNQPITRLSYLSEVNRMAGQQAMDTLVTKKLILQEAKKRQVAVSDDELSQEFKAIEELATQQDMTIDDLLALQGLDRSVLLAEIRIQKLLEKMVSQVEVTDEELEAYWAENQDFFPNQTFVEASEQISSQLKQQNLSQSIQAFITQIQAEAKIISWL